MSIIYLDYSNKMLAGSWFGTCFMFPYLIYWECHSPNWRTHIFQRGRYTTNQILDHLVEWCILKFPKWGVPSSMDYSQCHCPWFTWITPILVGGLEHFFSYIGNNPSHWLSYFSEGLTPPTSWMIPIKIRVVPQGDHSDGSPPGITTITAHPCASQQQ